MTRCGVNGKDFRARVEITNTAGAVVAAVGETCERVDPNSLGWLLEQRLIEPTGAAVSALGRQVETAVESAGIETRTEGEN